MNSNWYEKSFGEDYLIVYRHRNEEHARREVGAMVQWMALPAGARMLDVGCGTGRHANALHALGFQVTGLDLSEVLLAEARSSDPAGAVEWVHADMRALPFTDASYDAAVNWFTSFGYFGDGSEHVRVLTEIRRILKPGGAYLIDFLNAAHVKQHLVPLSERKDEPTGLWIREERSIEDDVVVKKIKVSPAADQGGAPRFYEERVHLFELSAFEAMMAEAGLTIDAVRGDYDGSTYSAAHSARLILTGRRAE